MIPKKLAFVAAAALVGLVAFPTQALAKKYTPSQFRQTLKAAIQNRKGPSAYNKAAGFLQQALGDKSNKRFARNYAVISAQLLRGGAVPLRRFSVAINTLVKGLVAGYFRGLRYNLYDARFNQALTVLLRKIPLSQKTQVVSQAIYNTLKTYSKRRGVAQDAVFAYYQTIDFKNRLPEPVS